MRNIYLSSTLMWGSREEEIITTIHCCGLGGMELWTQQLATTNLDALKLAKLAQQRQLDICLHAKSWDLNFGSLNKEVREASTKAILSCIDIAYSMEVKEVTVHPPRATIAPLKQLSLQYARQELAHMLAYGREKGVNISLEIMEKIPKELVTTPKEYETFVGEMATELMTTLDIAHCCDEQEFWDYAEALNNMSKVHISNKKGTKLHTALGQGDFDFEALMPKLLQLKKPIVIEGWADAAHYNILEHNMTFLKDLKERDKW